MAGLIEQNQAIIALAILLAVFVGFLAERFPPSAIATAGVAAFLGLGLIDSGDLSTIMANPAPATIAAMFVLSGALVRTGVLEAAAQWAVRKAAQAPLTHQVPLGSCGS